MSNQKYLPLGSRVIIVPMPDSEEDSKVGSILMADSAIIFQKGTVICAGHGERAINTGKLIPMEVSVGEVVLIRKAVPHLPIMIDGVSCMLVRESDIECVVG